MRYVLYQDRRIAYTLEGKGELVVLLHGFCEDGRVWEDFKHDLLEEQYRVLCVDLPGFGRSDTAAEVSIDYFARCVEAVLQEIGLPPAVVIGHSMGGYVALALAEHRPAWLRGLGLFHSHPFADSPETRDARHKNVEFIERAGHAIFIKQLFPKLFAPKYPAGNPFLIDKLSFRATQYPPEGITDALKAMAARPDRGEVLRRAAMPVLFIVGKEDSVINMETNLEQIHLPPVADIHLLDRVGHMGMFEAQRATQLIVRRFADFCYRQSDRS